MVMDILVLVKKSIAVVEGTDITNVLVMLLIDVQTCV